MLRYRLAPLLRTRRTTVLMVFDAAALAAAYVLSAMLRYDRGALAVVVAELAVVTVAGVAVHLLLGLVVRVYHGRVAVGSTEETILLSLTACGAGLALGIANLVVDPQPIARSVPLGAPFVGLILMLLGRAVWRSQLDRVGLGSADAEPALVVGAGWSGRQLVQSMLDTPDQVLRPVGFLDDDPWMRRRRHHGVPVVGTVADLPTAVERTGAIAVVLAIPKASKELKAHLADVGARLGVAVKILPSYAEAVSSQVDIRDVRDIDLADVLGRSVVETNIESIAHYLTGKRVLVTGAGGSIGSELCRQIDRWGPSELTMLDRDESALHAVQLLIRGRALLDSPEVVLVDIRDTAALTAVFEERRPEVVFHAAALKHLPMLEQYPAEGVKTNVLGTANVLEAAAAVGVERFVNISTDKAADPTSVLGSTKRVAEMLTVGMADRAPGAYLSVRFGNVLGSRGSVLTAFAAQIAAGGPVTVTHPEVTRFFMTVEEAVQLVIQAGALGSGGETMVLDMGEPVRIEDVAKRLIAQSGKRIEIVYTGLRDGEKLHEQLFGAQEPEEPTRHGLITHVTVPALDPRAVSTSLHLVDGDEARAYARRLMVAGASKVPAQKVASYR
ncbi:polysaccharide biosynthesis protein [Nocardioides perillae]|uniref:FlaA1/EpsC-like NDP-sugar epimerase n=1 Tax=Nocardioides perillae TaxID=1119534 RepID=A0A7Y9RQK1_9ACTN|nr:nucleoside-diphosphate sugar epimerase/dehydratase [Nocardioides perillae]NYG54712.1 FlaA1/EpsC-like NDP-sugar epimerase [Nocardioides perillae]